MWFRCQADDRIRSLATGAGLLMAGRSTWRVVPYNIYDALSDDCEVKVEAKSCAAVTDASVFDDLLCSYSDWFRLQKAVVWLSRFKSYCREKFLKKAPLHKLDVRNGAITVFELRAATNDIVQYVPRQLAQKPRTAYRKLNPLTEDGLMKVGGRLDRAPISYGMRHSIILPRTHHVTDLIIMHYHMLCGHKGPAHVLASLRDNQRTHCRTKRLERMYALQEKRRLP